MALCVAAPYALTSASNFFEIAVAAAIAMFCFTPRAAPATVVGVLVEFAVMLARRSRHRPQPALV